MDMTVCIDGKTSFPHREREEKTIMLNRVFGFALS